MENELFGNVIMFQSDDSNYLPTIALVLNKDGTTYVVDIDGSIGRVRSDQIITIFEKNEHAIELAREILINFHKKHTV